MSRMRTLLLVLLTAALTWVIARQTTVHAMAAANEPSRAELEKQLWEVDQQWLCSTGSGPYHKPFKECIDFRNKFWAPQFFEISTTGKVDTKAQMVARQLAPGYTVVQPDPSEFKLMGDYGNFAVATDHTMLKIVDANGKVTSETDTRVLRMFVKENGQWRPAGAALVPITSK